MQWDGLPVEVALKISGQCVGGRVALLWITPDRLGKDGFDVAAQLPR